MIPSELETADAPRALAEIVAGLPAGGVVDDEEEPKEKTPRTGPPKDASLLPAEVLAKFPFLRRQAEREAASSKPAPGKSDDAPKWGLPIFKDMDDDELEALFSALEKEREGWGGVDKMLPGKPYFKVVPLGSNWTKIHRDVPYDAVKGFASGQKAQQWCDKYGFNHSARFDITLYGPHEVVEVAQVW